jgi:hypothetical protein
VGMHLRRRRKRRTCWIWICLSRLECSSSVDMEFLLIENV